MSSLVTAWELTNQPNWQDRWDITLYQQGWRLGGKGASGRNAAAGQRIEEHGLHILFGFYDNAFKVMREVYGELGRHPSKPLSDWKKAFKPHSLIVMMEEVDGQHIPWAVDAPTNNEVPGDGNTTPTPWEYVQRIIDYMLAEFTQWGENSAAQATGYAMNKLGLGGELTTLRTRVHEIINADAATRDSAGLLKSLEEFTWNAFRNVISGAVTRVLSAEATYLEMAHELVRSMSPDPLQHDAADKKGICWLLRCFANWIWSIPLEDTPTRRLKYMVDFGSTIVIGLLEDGLIVPPQDWFKIDDLDFRDWLKKHGAHKETIACPLVTGLYDAIFSTGRTVGAGTIVHLFLRMGFTYRGAVLWKMQAGMGDTIFAPLYTVLERRGVRFEYFHNVNHLYLSPDKKTVERIEIGVQATLKSGPYQPLVDVLGLPCWPSEPDYDQLVEGAALKAKGIDLEDWWADWPDVATKTLVAGTDFDLCVLGISIGALPFLCKEMVEDSGNPRFKNMIEKVATCETQALQLWFTPALAQLGWPLASPVVIPYVEPFDTWADMSQLIDKEDWPASHPVGNIAYLCSILDDDEPLPPRSDHDYPKRQRERVFKNALQWTENNPRALWPNAEMPGSPNALNYYWLVDLQNQRGRDRLKSQYWRAVTSPSERYVLCVTNSSRARLQANESGYSNLLMTGDWILTPISAGCLEAAVMAGLQTANCVTDTPRLIVGDWLSRRGVQS
jgi:uncharacterized protein with NAD-binding domain and iron-sulfur cluster